MGSNSGVVIHLGDLTEKDCWYSVRAFKEILKLWFQYKHAIQIKEINLTIQMTQLTAKNHLQVSY